MTAINSIGELKKCSWLKEISKLINLTFVVTPYPEPNGYVPLVNCGLVHVPLQLI